MIVAVLQAGSGTAGPELLLSDVSGEPLILRQLDRIRGARTLTKTVTVLPAVPEFDELARRLGERRRPVFRGVGDDLELTARAVRQHTAGGECTHVVRLTAGHLLGDPEVTDEAVRFALNSRAAWTGNTVRRSYPAGLDVEVVAADLLFAAAAEPPALGDRLAAFVRSRPDAWPQAHLTRPADLSRLDWAARDPETLAFVRRVYEALHPADPFFNTQDVLDLLRREEAAAAAA